MNDLRKFSDEQLLAEIDRRMKVRAARNERLAFEPCDECEHFKFWLNGDPPGDYNPCELGKKMKFRVPEYAHDPDSGYFLRNCRERTQREVESAPLPPE